MKARHERRPRRRTDRTTGVVIGKKHPGLSHFIEIWGFENLLSVATQITIAQIIGQDVDDVGPGRVRRFIFRGMIVRLGGAGRKA